MARLRWAFDGGLKELSRIKSVFGWEDMEAGTLRKMEKEAEVLRKLSMAALQSARRVSDRIDGVEDIDIQETCSRAITVLRLAWWLSDVEAGSDLVLGSALHMIKEEDFHVRVQQRYLTSDHTNQGTVVRCQMSDVRSFLLISTQQSLRLELYLSFLTK